MLLMQITNYHACQVFILSTISRHIHLAQVSGWDLCNFQTRLGLFFFYGESGSVVCPWPFSTFLRILTAASFFHLKQACPQSWSSIFDPWSMLLPSLAPDSLNLSPDPWSLTLILDPSLLFHQYKPSPAVISGDWCLLNQPLAAPTDCCSLLRESSCFPFFPLRDPLSSALVFFLLSLSLYFHFVGSSFLCRRSEHCAGPSLFQCWEMSCFFSPKLLRILSLVDIFDQCQFW